MLVGGKENTSAIQNKRRESCLDSRRLYMNWQDEKRSLRNVLGIDIFQEPGVD